QQKTTDALLACDLSNLQKFTNSMELDSACEAWLMEQFDCTIDFDIEDGLKKLVEYKLIEQQNEPLSCRSAEVLCDLLDRQWQSYMQLPESRN
ncbi:MAG: hypothetical protein JAZ05_15755, partial [Candidatus Thiodiazotropha taylori]|nr:hypothetical protein [Candidatus Thiodiazotropha taylori]MCW4293470.1 hypothetical protein [Candidatus Thiodiazotropha taylori]